MSKVLATLTLARGAFIEKEHRAALLFLRLALVMVSVTPSVLRAAEPPPIKVGILHSLSGTMSISEASLVDAALLAIDEINENGGVLGRKIQPVQEDGASDEQVFAQKARKLIEKDLVCSIFGCWTSASRKAVIPVVEQHNNLLWYPVQYEGQESSRNVIYSGATPNQQILPSLEWAIQRLNAHRFYLVGSDYVFPRSANQIIKQYLAARGAVCVAESYQPLGSTDFAAVVTDIARTRPALVVNTLNGTSNLDFFAELHRQGLGAASVPVLSFSIAEDEIQKIGTTLSQDHYVAWNYFQSVATPENQAFVTAFKRKYGADRVTDASIHAAYLQVYLFAKAVTQAGSINPNDIRAAAAGLLLQAPGGLVRVDPHSQNLWSTSKIGRVRADGQIDVVWETSDLVEPLVQLDAAALSRIASESEPSLQADFFSPDHPERLQLALRDADVARRRMAASIARTKYPVQVSLTGALTNALHDEDWLVRRNAALALGRYGPAGRLLLCDAYDGADMTTRAAILEALSATAWNDERSGGVIERALEDKQIDVRNAAVRALRGQRPLSQRFTEALVRFLFDESFEVRRAALSVLQDQRPSSDAVVTAMVRHSAGRQWSRQAVTALADAVEDQGRHRNTKNLGAIDGLLRDVHAARIDTPQLASAERTADHLRDIREISSHRLALWFDKLGLFGPVALAYIALILFWLLLLLFFPYGLYAIDAQLSHLTARLPSALAGHNLLMLFLFGFFAGHRRVLDAWVARHLGVAGAAFRNKETVSERLLYIPLPVSVDAQTHERLTAEILRSQLRADRWCVLVTGDGGTGKTALACQIALWAMADRKENRLEPSVPMIPVLLEAAEYETAIADGRSLRSIVSAHLRELIGTAETVPELFVEQLLRKGRILLIADDVLLDPNGDDFPVSRLLFTARSRERFHGISKTVITPLACDPRRVSPFLQAYLRERTPSHALTDDDLHAACKQFESVARGHAVPVLFAKMYAEQLLLVHGDDKPVDADLPSTTPELVLGFINALNGTRRDPALSDELVQTVALQVAAACVSDELVFGRGPVERLQDLLKTEAQRAVVEHLEKRLKLIRFHGAGHLEIVFTLEPVGEYLAAMHHVRNAADDTGAWRTFVSRAARAVTLGGDATRSYLLAVRDCCLAEGRLYRTPSWVAAELARLAGPRAENLESEVRIGALYSLTGPMAISEAALYQAVQLAVEEINAGGLLPGRTLVLETRDGQSNVDVFAQQARDLIVRSRVSSLFGCWTSAERMAVRTVVEDHDHLLWYAVQYEGFEQSQNIVYTGATANQQILPALDWCIRELKVRRAFLVGSRYIFPWAANRIMKAYLERHGVICVGEEYRDLGARDFRDIAGKIRSSGADLVLNTINGDGNIFFFDALGREGITREVVPVLSFSLAENELKRIGTRNAVGHYCAWNYFQSLDTEENHRFVDAFRRRFGSESVTDDPMEAAYFGVYLFAKAVHKAGSVDPRAVREAVRGLEHLAPGGLVKIDEQNQHTWTVARIGQIGGDGQFRIVWSSEGEIHPDPFLSRSELDVDVSLRAYEADRERVFGLDHDAAVATTHRVE